jgi:type IX secretion system PorP/SprF family membrane protein
MQRKALIILFLLGINIGWLKGQDPHFSQFFATSMYLNPAFTGNTPSHRIGVAQRVQWYGLESRYTTSDISFDKNVKRKNIGLGGMLLYDDQAGHIRSLDATGLFSYHLKITDRLALRAGFRTSFLYRSLQSSDLHFVDQYNNNGYTGLPTGEAVHKYDKTTLSMGTGFLIFTPKAFLGVAVDHVNGPDVAFYGTDGRIPMKISVHGGRALRFKTQNVQMRYGQNKPVVNYDVVFTPSFNLKMQGKNTQLDIGASTFYYPINFGIYYRGMPMHLYEKQIANNESIILSFGVQFGSVRVGYSYDWTISSLYGKTNGAHEFTIIYEFSRNKQSVMGGKFIAKEKRPVPCPEF